MLHRSRVRPLLVSGNRWLQDRLYLVALDPFEQRGHIGVNHGSQIQRHGLRENEAADYRHTERAPRLATSAPAECDGYRAQQRRHGGHHDRTETNQTALVNRVGMILAFFPLGFESEINL